MSSTNPSGLWNESFGKVGATLKALQDHGVTQAHLARLRSDPSYARGVAEVMCHDYLKGSIHRILARTTMGNNFFGVDEWRTFYGVCLSDGQLRRADDFPWSKDLLDAPCPFHEGKSIKDTHFAFLGLKRLGGRALTIIRWKELHPEPTGIMSLSPATRYRNEEFAAGQTCDFRWYLMPLGIVPGSTDKTYQDQVAMLRADYEVPFAVEEATKFILFGRRNGTYLYSGWSRCRDVTSLNAHRACVGYFSGLVYIDCQPKGHHSHNIGLATARLVQSPKGS